MEPRNRIDVLKEVNRILESEGLAPWNDLRRIGKHRQREFEITGVSHVIRDLQQYYVLIMFQVIRPDGSTGLHGVRITRHIPTCLVAIINDQVLCVQQHRLTTGKWTIELPRGWVRRSVASACKGGAAQALLERELGTNWVESLEPFEPIQMGAVWEDTGTRFDQVQIFLIESRTEQPLSKQVGCINPKLYSWDQVHAMIDEGVINDQASLTALYKTERFLLKRCST